MKYRQHLWLWAAMTGLPAILMLGLFWLLDPAGEVPPYSMKGAILGSIAGVIAFAYALVCGIMILSSERESGMPVLPRIEEWGTKLWFAATLVISQNLFLAGLATSLGIQQPTVEEPQTGSVYDLAGGYFVLLPAMALPALSWGMLGSALCRKVSIAAAVSLALFPVSIGVIAIFSNKGGETAWSPEIKMFWISTGLTLFALVASAFIFCRRHLHTNPSMPANTSLISGLPWFVRIAMTLSRTFFSVCALMLLFLFGFHVNPFDRFSPWPERTTDEYQAFLEEIALTPRRAAEKTSASEEPLGVLDKQVPENKEDLKAIQEQVKLVLKKLIPATVALDSGGSGNIGGSGVIVSKDGYVLTAAHTYHQPGRTATVILSDGRRVQGKTLGVNYDMDSGLIKITDEGEYPFLEMGNSKDLKDGQWCILVGHPGGYQTGRSAPVRLGRIQNHNYRTICTDCSVAGGDSGGPLVDMQGKVIGIHHQALSKGGARDVRVKTYRETWDRLTKSVAWWGERHVRFRNEPEPEEMRWPKGLAAFKSVIAKPSQSTVRIQCDGKEAVLGTVVGQDGWIITKASELKGKVVCRLKNGRDFEAKTVGVEDAYDLALLKIEAKGLVPVEWSESKTAEVGNWVATAGLTDEPVAVGVVSVAARSPAWPPPSYTAGIFNLGILLDVDGTTKINCVPRGYAGDKAGLKVNDVIVSVSGTAVNAAREVSSILNKYNIGDVVIIKVKRGSGETELEVKLDKQPPLGEDLMPGLSQRRAGFPIILQHDSVVQDTECGGPLVDLDGKVIGINIARAGPTATYAVPSEAVRPLLLKLGLQERKKE